MNATITLSNIVASSSELFPPVGRFPRKSGRVGQTSGYSTDRKLWEASGKCGLVGDTSSPAADIILCGVRLQTYVHVH